MGIVTPYAQRYDSDEIDTKIGKGDFNAIAVTVCTHGEDVGAAGLLGSRLRAVFLKNATLILLDTVLSSVTV